MEDADPGLSSDEEPAAGWPAAPAPDTDDGAGPDGTAPSGTDESSSPPTAPRETPEPGDDRSGTLDDTTHTLTDPLTDTIELP